MAVLLEWTQVGLKPPSTEAKKQQKAATCTVETLMRWWRFCLCGRASSKNEIKLRVLIYDA
jgi:hypothetical protein